MQVEVGRAYRLQLRRFPASSAIDIKLHSRTHPSGLHVASLTTPPPASSASSYLEVPWTVPEEEEAAGGGGMQYLTASLQAFPAIFAYTQAFSIIRAAAGPAHQAGPPGGGGATQEGSPGAWFGG